MIEIERLVAPEAGIEEAQGQQDRALRPKYLRDYIGQESIREQLQVFIQAALGRQEALDHVLIFGPPGLGKTTLAHVIATEMGVNIKQTSGPVIERAGDLAALLTHLKPHDVLFIDEIHRLNPAIEEILYPALEDYRLDIMIGEGPGARTVKIDLPPFTLIGATTRAGMLTHPLRDRFGIVVRLAFYDTVALQTIVMRSARLLPCPISDEGALAVAQRARGTPRIANRLLRRVRDFAEVAGVDEVSAVWVDQALTKLDVDQHGLDWLDRRFLECLVTRFQGGPVGLDSLASVLGEERATIEDVIEPFLLQKGFVQRTHRGRVATALTYRYLGVAHDNKEQSTDGCLGDDTP